MQKVFIEDLLPGMVVGKNVYSERKKFLLSAKTIINEEIITDLKKWNILAVYVDMGFTDGIHTESIISAQTREVTLKHLSDFFAQGLYSHRITHNRQMEESVVGIVDEILSKPANVLNLTEIRQYDDYLLSHSLDVCVIAVLSAANLGWPREKLIQLGLAGLMHDIGKIKIEPEILLKPTELSEKEFAEIKKHTLLARDILHEEPSIVEAACQHHERFDGSGYPFGIKGTEINEFARIIAISDVYDAMTTNRTYRKSIEVNEVLEMIYASGGTQFDHDFVWAFSHCVAAYPVGTAVELNDGSLGVVVKNYPGFSLYPRVRILKERDGRVLHSPREINLHEEKKMINRILDIKECFVLSQNWCG